MQDTIDIDAETVRLLDQLAKLRHTTSGQIAKDIVLATARSAGLHPRTSSKLSPEERMRRALGGLKAISPHPTDDDRPHEEIIGYDERGLP